jgi:hypothetical protein
VVVRQHHHLLEDLGEGAGRVDLDVLGARGGRPGPAGLGRQRHAGLDEDAVLAGMEQVARRVVLGHLDPSMTSTS